MAIVGRPNVGKSTLFNRLAGRRLALVGRRPGITRDRLYAPAEWRGHSLTLIDTGGLTGADAAELGPDETRRATVEQTLAALREADAVLLVVDGQAGLHPEDAEIADLIRRAGKPALVVVNKAEGAAVRAAAGEFYALGLGDPVPVSALHGTGTGDLLDVVLERWRAPRAGPGSGGLGEAAPEADAPGEGVARSGETAPPEERPLRVCLLGRPNVGKSSLVNRLLGRERVTVSSVAGTTRDAVDVPWRAAGRSFVLVDTAGLRRHARRADAVEHWSAGRAEAALESSDVVLVVMDATEPATDQDKRVAGLAHERGRAVILLVNKWDLAAGGDERAAAACTRRIRREMPFVAYAPILFVSALTGQRLGRLPALIERVAANHARRVDALELLRVVEEAVLVQAPPGGGRRPLRILGVRQTGVRPPSFAFSVSDPERMPASYARYLENRLRAAFDFAGTPLRLRFVAGRGGASGDRPVRPAGRRGALPGGGGATKVRGGRRGGGDGR